MFFNFFKRSLCADLLIGFGLGVYFLPILTAEKGLDTVAIEALSQSALRQGTFVRDLPGSDELHWGDGVIMAMPIKSGWMVRFHPARIIVCI